MTANELLERCESRGIRLWAESGELRGDGPIGAGSLWLSAQLSDHKAELLELLNRRDQDGREPPRRATEECATGITQGRRCPYCQSDDLAVRMDAPKPHWGRLWCLSCDRFVGYAPTPLELAAEWKMPYGHYRGQTLAEIAARDLAYLQWAALNMNSPRIREMCAYFLEHMAGKPRSSGGAASQPGDSVVAADDGDEIPF